MSDLSCLSKSASRLLVLLYRYYVSSVSDGIPRREARLLGDADQIAARFCPGDSVEDVSDLLLELARADFIHASVFDDLACNCVLTSSCIVAMENRFPDGVKSIIHGLSDLKQLFS